jgi:COP9 signalosome complex subunit 5
MVITDAQAIPCEGFETRVVADDQSVINYMISLGENNELSTREVQCITYTLATILIHGAVQTFCGWYHTHPFDLEEYSHCYLSATDGMVTLTYPTYIPYAHLVSLHNLY